MEATAAPNGPGLALGHPSFVTLSVYSAGLVLALDGAVIIKQTEFFNGTLIDRRS